MRACRLFNFKLDRTGLEDAFDQLFDGGKVDFGLLDEPSQKNALVRMMSNQRDADRLLHINPFLAAPGNVPNPAELIEHNRQAILSNYNPADYRRNLLNVYRKVGTGPVGHRIDKPAVVSAFLDPNQFSLLKWSDYREIA